jgi:hypothetical protein
VNIICIKLKSCVCPCTVAQGDSGITQWICGAGDKFESVAIQRRQDRQRMHLVVRAKLKHRRTAWVPRRWMTAYYFRWNGRVWQALVKL